MMALWPAWGDVTRMLESTRLALTREQSVWTSLQLDSPQSARISVREGESTYQVSLEQHLQALDETRLFYGAVLMLSYALAEAAALGSLGLDSRSVGGIEELGTRLLDARGEVWDNVKDHKGGAVEVAVARNLLAHGATTLDHPNVERLHSAGRMSWAIGDRMSVDYTVLDEYRARLRSLMRVAGIGP
jgi:hypothetical protein